MESCEESNNISLSIFSSDESIKSASSISSDEDEDIFTGLNVRAGENLPVLGTPYINDEEANICHDEADNKSFVILTSSFLRVITIVSFVVNSILIGIWWFSVWILSPQHGKETVYSLLVCFAMMICGVSLAVQNSRGNNKNRILIKLVLVLAVICTLFCVCSLVYLVAVVQKNLDKLEQCEFDEYKRTCSCMGPNRLEIKFNKNLDCDAVKNSLKNLSCGVSVLFSVGLIISIMTALSAAFLLRKEKRDRYERSRRMIRRTRRHRNDYPIQSYRVPTESRRVCSGRQQANGNTSQTDSLKRPLSTLDGVSLSSDYSYEGISPPSYNDAIRSLTLYKE